MSWRHVTKVVVRCQYPFGEVCINVSGRQVAGGGFFLA